MKNRYIIVLLFLISFLSFSENIPCALSNETSKYAPVPCIGARVIGMGSAFVAVADDVHSITWTR